jgi:predicted Zn-dependent peptidase
MDIPQSIILFYIEALDPTDPDFYTLDILNSIYGGAPFVSRLWFSVRENSGYAYNVGTRYQSIQQCSYIRGRTSVATENVKKTIALIQDDVKKLQNTPVEDKELKYHQDLKTGQQSVALDSTVAITQYLMTCLLMGRSVDDVNQRNHKIKSINVHDIERISKKIFSKPMTFFVVGRPH